MKINFNSYDLSVCGGNRCIMELANGLAKRGHNVTITHAGNKKYRVWFTLNHKVVVNDLSFPSDVARMFRKYYLRKRGIDYNVDDLLISKMPGCDINVATWCLTAYPTFFSGKGKPYYLVQDYEPLFKQDVVFQKKSRLSYELGLTKLCVSRWLAEKVGGSYLGNGVNRERFRPLYIDKEFDVMVISRKNDDRKGNYAAIIEKLRNRGLTVVDGCGCSDEEIVKLYNQSRCFLFISVRMEGFGYPPLEAMACGTSVVSTPCSEYLVNGENAVIIPYDFSLCDVLDSLKRVSTIEEKLVKVGLDTVKEYDIQKVVDRFEILTATNCN